MRRSVLTYLLISVVLVLFSSCWFKQPVPPPEKLAAPQSIDWSKFNLPASGEQGNWALSPERINFANIAFSSDYKTIYLLGSNNHVFLRKSTDGGHNWVTLPTFEQLGLYEAFFMKMLNDELFIGTTDQGIYRSNDGGASFEKLPPLPGIRGRTSMGFVFDLVADADGHPTILSSSISFEPDSFGGVWMLKYPYDNWLDMGVGNAEAGSTYNVWNVAFSPNYDVDRQIIALVSDGTHLRVTFKNGDEPWGQSIADAQIPDAKTECDLFSASYLAFPDDYDSKNPAVYFGLSLWTEILFQTPQYADLYRIDGEASGSVPSKVTDLNVGGRGTSTPVYSVVVQGPSSNLTILAGGVGQVHHSTDGGRTWTTSAKPPTGGAIYMIQDPLNGHSIYALPSDPGNVMVPRGVSLPVNEPGFSRSTDGGITWNQLSFINTTIDETPSAALSPNYNQDKTLFMLTRSSHLLIVSMEKDEVVTVTRDPNQAGTTATVEIIPHQDNPPEEKMTIDRRGWVTGTGPTVVLSDKKPSVSIRVLPVLEQPGMPELLEMMRATRPWYLKQYLNIEKQPRKVLIYVLEGSVKVAKEKGSRNALDITVDGIGDDWQSIEPLAIDKLKDDTARSANEDLKSLYIANDNSSLYFMVESNGEKFHSPISLSIDKDMDGDADFHVYVRIETGTDSPHVYLVEQLPGGGTNTKDWGRDGAFGYVLEFKVPADIMGVNRFGITKVEVLSQDGTRIVDTYEEYLEIGVNSKSLPSVSTPLNPIPFPSTESLWKTTDGGHTWERILTSGLNITVGNKKMRVGDLASVALSVAFAQDNTLFVYESSGRVWVSDNGGITFAPYK